MATTETTEENFYADVIQSTTPVLVDFWAPWCNPCRMIAPVLEEISEQYGDKLKIVKLNTDDHPAVAQQYGVTGLPTLHLYVGGEQVKSVIGAQPKQKLLAEIEPHLPA